MSREAQWKRAVSIALALGGGLAWSLCFAPRPSLWLPWIALAPLLLLLGRRRAFLWGWLFGLSTWAAAMAWIAPTIEVHGGLPRPLAWLVLVLLAGYLGFDQAVFAWLGQRVWRRGGGWALFGLPALWVVLELGRGFVFGGFPWNLAAYAWVEMPGALPLAAWIGAYGVSYLVAFANTGLALAVSRRRWELAALALLAPLVILAAAGRWSGGEPQRWRPGQEVRVLQPATPIVTSLERSRLHYRRLIAMSEAECDAPAAAGAPGKLLIWPESAAWPRSWERSAELRRDVARLSAAGCEVLLGSATSRADGIYNSVLLVSRGRPVGEYSKRHLVPFGEVVPLAGLLPFVGTLARNAGDFTPGRELGLLPWGEEQIAAAICYEVIFPGAVAEQVRAGASLLVTVTNDAWYGDTAAPWQHFRAARFRAAENRRPLLRAALTGVSGVIDRRGALDGQLGVGERGVLASQVRGAADLSPFSRAPWAAPLAAVLLAAFAIVSSRRPSASNDAVHRGSPR